MVPPKLSGKVTKLAAAGDYTVTDVICTLEDLNGKEVEVKMAHFWPVRQPRPV